MAKYRPLSLSVLSHYVQKKNISTIHSVNSNRVYNTLLNLVLIAFCKTLFYIMKKNLNEYTCTPGQRKYHQRFPPDQSITFLISLRTLITTASNPSRAFHIHQSAINGQLPVTTCKLKCEGDIQFVGM